MNKYADILLLRILQVKVEYGNKFATVEAMLD
jgi:hypothetical protein